MSVDTLTRNPAFHIHRGPVRVELDQLVRLTVDQYAAMLTSGVLAEGAPVELLNGVLRWKNRATQGEAEMTVGKRHAATVIRLYHLLTMLMQGHRCFVQSQSPISLSAIDEPEPDLCIVSGSIEAERPRHPTPDEIILLIEVADSSLAYDLGEKLEAYAAGGIAEYWVVNLVNCRVEVYRQPDLETGKYLERIDHGIDDRVEFHLPTGEAFTIATDQFLRS